MNPCISVLSVVNYLFFFTTDCTEITDVLTDFNSSYTHVPGVPGSSFYQCSHNY
ncbi:MAG: hypothetical protein H6Q24_1458 [Bacteroidetes bacterium]|nr:hypothetical protein [Bacteroidota bacterium]